MKNLIVKRLSIICLLITSGLFAQEQTILDHFNVVESNGNLILNWQITSGKTCNGIQIYRSVNNTEFVQVGEIDGVCGSVTRPINYTFSDNNPAKNQVNRYRLDLGGYGNSETVSAEIISLDSKTYQLRPNPSSNSTILLFNNPKEELATISIYSLSGKLQKTLTTKNNTLFIDVESLEKGLYFFNIIIKNQFLTSGKIIVQ